MCNSCKPLLGNAAHPTMRSVVESIRGDPEDPGCVAPSVHFTYGPSKEGLCLFLLTSGRLARAWRPPAASETTSTNAQPLGARN